MTFTEGMHTGAAYTRRTAKKNPVELLHRLREGDSKAPKDYILKKWAKAVIADDDYTMAAVMDSGMRYWEDLERTKRTATSAPKPRMSAAARDAAIKKAADAVRQIVVLDLRLSSGKRVRDATFAELLAEGGNFLRLGNAGKPKQIVGKVLSPAEANKIWFGE